MNIMKACYTCGSSDRVHKHHLDWHHDNNATENITFLCQRCHTELHKQEAQTPGRRLRNSRSSLAAPHFWQTWVIQGVLLESAFRLRLIA